MIDRDSPATGTPGSLGAAADEARVMTIAAAAWLGTLAGMRITVAPAALLVVAYVVVGLMAMTRRATGRSGATIVVILVVFPGCFLRGGHAAREYQPFEIGALQAAAVIRSDPEPAGAGWRAETQLVTGERLEVTAFGRPGFELRQLEVGDEVLIEGRVRPVGDRTWLRARHIVGRVSADDVALSRPASGFNRVVNDLRSMIVDGAVTFDDRGRALYTGLVIGDDRFQPLAQRAQFRASGLTHLLAVSGQNVAFVLLVAQPLLMRLGRRARFGAIVGILVLFVAMTRAEPSVLRAATAAGVATWALITGRTGSGLRTLAVGVAVLTVIDPFLIDVVGFQLSVAASVGIIVVSPLLLHRLPAPLTASALGSPIAQALSVTVGAQIGVAPLLIAYFGPLPLASIPANLAAGWAAGAVMTLGLTVGPVSGMFHRARLPELAALIQWPSRLLVDWIDGVAGWSVELGLPRLGPAALGATAVLCVIVALRPRQVVRGRAVVVATVLVAGGFLVTGMTSSPDQPVDIVDGVFFVPAGSHNGSAVLVVGEPAPSAVDAVLAARLGHVDAIITERGDATTATVVSALSEVVDAAVVLAPPQHRVRGATRVTDTLVVATASGAVIVTPDSTGSRLVVTLPTGDPATSSSSLPTDE